MQTVPNYCWIPMSLLYCFDLKPYKGSLKEVILLPPLCPLLIFNISITCAIAKPFCAQEEFEEEEYDNEKEEESRETDSFNSYIQNRQNKILTQVENAKKS